MFVKFENDYQVTGETHPLVDGKNVIYGCSEIFGVDQSQPSTLTSYVRGKVEVQVKRGSIVSAVAFTEYGKECVMDCLVDDVLIL